MTLGYGWVNVQLGYTHAALIGETACPRRSLFFLGWFRISETVGTSGLDPINTRAGEIRRKYDESCQFLSIAHFFIMFVVSMNQPMALLAVSRSVSVTSRCCGSLGCIKLLRLPFDD